LFKEVLENELSITEAKSKLQLLHILLVLFVYLIAPLAQVNNSKLLVAARC